MTFLHRTRAQKISHRGYGFQSKLEAALFDKLKAREDLGELEIEQIQETVYLSRARIKYIPDFRIKILASGEIERHEAKGLESERWPTIKKLWKAYGDSKLYIWKGSYMSLKLDEVIVPIGGGDE